MSAQFHSQTYSSLVDFFSLASQMATEETLTSRLQKTRPQKPVGTIMVTTSIFYAVPDVDTDNG